MSEHPMDMAAQSASADGVVAHTSNPSEYHPLPVPTGKRLPTGAVIPRADADGVSLGLRTKPERSLNIDPEDVDTGTGGIELDLSKVSPEISKQAFDQANQETTDSESRTIRAYAIMRELMAKGEEMAIPSRLAARPPAPKPAETVPAPEPLADQVPQPAPVADSSSWTSSISELSQAVAFLVQDKLEQRKEAVEAAVELPPEPEPEPPVPTPLDPNLIPKEKALDILHEGFDSLEIPSLGPEAEKPKHKVIFDLGVAGKLACWYHWVNEHDRGLFLIYDTRFEYGTMYEPPNLGSDRPIEVTHTNSGRTFLAYSLGFSHPFGVFHIINLALAEEPTPTEPQEMMMAA